MSAPATLLRSARHGSGAVLPPRYDEPWRAPFDSRVATSLAEGVRILDIGGGRCPAIESDARPRLCHYAGLDISGDELSKAPGGAYDEVYASDAADFVAELAGRFDLAISWQVLEHITSLDKTVRNIREYLRRGGRFIAVFSGTFSMFGLMNKMLPRRLGVWGLRVLLKRPPHSVFPAPYHHCWHDAIERAFAPWTAVELVPMYRGAGYLSFSHSLQQIYLAYENQAERRRWLNVATHYLVDAIK